MKKSSATAMLPFEAEDAAKILAAKVRTARIVRGWTQEELAQRCEISKRTITNLEAGSVSVQLGFVLKVLWAVDLIDDFIQQIKHVGLNDHEFALLEATQPMRVREKGRSA
jgi:DNA-binding XRE family transcriptional regulator